MLLTLLLAAGVATLISQQQVSAQFETAALRLDQEGAFSAGVQLSIVEHEQMAHSLLNGEPGDRAAFIAQQTSLVKRFAAAQGQFDGPGQHDLLVRAEDIWQRALVEVGLWHDSSGWPPANESGHSADASLAAATDSARSILSQLDDVSRQVLRHDLGRAADLQYLTVALLATLFITALLLTGHLARRLTTDVLTPISKLREAVNRVRNGDLTHRVELRGPTVPDELDELTDAYNEMAQALSDSHEALSFQALHDPLTSLANRTQLAQRLSASFALHGDEHHPRESVLFIDVDDFKFVNDSYGHAAGDLLLTQIAERLRACVGPADLVVRLGGDEFALLVVDDDPGAAAEAVAAQVLDAFVGSFPIYGQHLTVAVSIGVAARQSDTADAEELLGEADFAMYMAKGQGKGRFQVFDRALRDQMHESGALNSLPGVQSAR